MTNDDKYTTHECPTCSHVHLPKEDDDDESRELVTNPSSTR